MVNNDREEIKEYVHGFVSAIQFLTILPIRINIEFEKKILHKSIIFFPIVGAIIGVILCLAAWGLSYAAPPILAAILLVVLWIMLSGGLHLDGLMDSADGLLSRRNKEQMLEIMKDSRVGAFGVISAIISIAVKWAALTFLFEQITEQLSVIWVVLIIVGTTMWSRWWMVIAISSWKPARNHGLGAMFHGIKLQYVSTSTAVSLFIYLIALMFYVVKSPLNMDFLWLALILPIGSAIVGWLTAKWMKAKLDGLTGDTYGAMTEVIESVNLVISVMFVYIML